MGLSIALGWTWRTVAGSVPGFQPALPEATFLLGVRDLDRPEAELLSQSRVTVVPPTQVSGELSRRLTAARLSDSLGYLHLDLDVLDPDSVGRANSLPAPGGLTLTQLTSAIGAIRSRVTLGAATIASYAPEYDRDQAVARAAFRALDAVLGETSKAKPASAASGS
jgi:arginase family enzyme